MCKACVKEEHIKDQTLDQGMKKEKAIPSIELSVYSQSTVKRIFGDQGI